MLAIMVGRSCHEDSSGVQSGPPASLQKGDGASDINASGLLKSSSESSHSVRPERNPRSVPPFIPSHDLPRGAIYAVQALMAYALMLAVMTFQAAYLISIVLGLGIGEMLFGRMGGKSLH